MLLRPTSGIGEAGIDVETTPAQDCGAIPDKPGV